MCHLTRRRDGKNPFAFLLNSIEAYLSEEVALVAVSLHIGGWNERIVVVVYLSIPGDTLEIAISVTTPVKLAVIVICQGLA